MLPENALPRKTPGTGTLVDFSGVWINEFPSTMTISQTNDEVKGSYKSPVSTGGIPATGSLQGYVDGHLISFVVHWKEFQAITAWVGQLDPKNPKLLKTLWQMVSQVAPGGEWDSINAGADSFSKQ
jgi:hypothetical protein